MFVSIRGRSRQIRQQLYDCPGEILKSEALQMVTNFLRIPANLLRSLRLLNNQCGEFLVNPLRMLRLLLVQVINSNLCDISMVKKQQCQCCNLPRSIGHFHVIRKYSQVIASVGKPFASILNVFSRKCPKNRNRFALFVMDSQAFATFYLQKMLANLYECLTITTNALPSIRIYCDAYENNKNMLS